MRHAHRRGVAHSGVAEEHRIHFGRGDLQPTAVDELLDAPDYEQVAIGVEIAKVAGAEPVLAKREAIGFGIILITAHDGRSAHQNFTDRPLRHGLAKLALDPDLGTAGDPDGTAAPPARRWRVLRNEARFGGTVSLDHRYLEQRFQLRLQA